MRVDEPVRRLSRAALIDEVRAGIVPGEAMVSSVESFGDGYWPRRSGLR